MERLRPVYETGVLRLLLRGNSMLYVALLRSTFDPLTGELWIGNSVLDRFLEDESLFGEFLRTPVSEGGVEPLVVEPPHVVVEVGA